MKLSRYCICGSAMQVRSDPPAAAEWLAAEFDNRHTGSGHAPCTSQQAARVRQRQERRALAEPGPDSGGAGDG